MTPYFLPFAGPTLCFARSTFPYLRSQRRTQNTGVVLRAGAKRKVPAAPASERAGTCDCTRVRFPSARKNLINRGGGSGGSAAGVTGTVREPASLQRRDSRPESWRRRAAEHGAGAWSPPFRGTRG